MKVLNVGSLSIDYVYRVERFVRPGETLSCLDFNVFSGGKGLNQSLALSLAGAKVFQLGAVNREEGAFLLKELQSGGVDTRYIRALDVKNGHTIIQIDPSGQNCILAYGGANRAITQEDLDAALQDFGPEDILVLQYETNATASAIEKAAKCGLYVVFNPSPVRPEIMSLPLERVNCFVLNEVEAEAICGERSPQEQLDALSKKFPGADVVLTLGAAGSMYRDHVTGEVFTQQAYPVQAVDTTAAGDTYLGYFVAHIAAGHGPRAALSIASRAAALCVSRPGAAPSIPSRAEVEAFHP